MRKLPVIMVGLAFVIVSCAPVPASIQPTEILPPTVPAQTQKPTPTTASQVPGTTPTAESLSEGDVTGPSTGVRRDFQPQLETISINMNEVVTLLPPDAIPAVLPQRAQDIMVLGAQADDAGIDPSVQVIGVEINGESRAYPIPFLSRHEIVNDEVGGRKIAVTW